MTLETMLWVFAGMVPIAIGFGITMLLRSSAIQEYVREHRDESRKVHNRLVAMVDRLEEVAVKGCNDSAKERRATDKESRTDHQHILDTLAKQGDAITRLLEIHNNPDRSGIGTDRLETQVSQLIEQGIRTESSIKSLVDVIKQLIIHTGGGETR